MMMFIVHVFIKVKPDKIDSFIASTIENARNSKLEPGIARFDFIQQSDDNTKFVLVEVYRTPEEAKKHKDTPHYIKWRDAVEDMMIEPRSSIKYQNIFPLNAGW
jgi:(4S)-4-hydroxy-5-phosphonooxypentane-2,3-dione isomerase